MMRFVQLVRFLSQALIPLALVAAWTTSDSAASTVSIDGLRCEYRTNPQGIDARQPRLSWVLHSDQRGAVQTGYQILVASSAQRLASDQGDRWDSGRVALDRSIQVPYAGQSLGSGARCYWTVRAWVRLASGEQIASSWSPAGSWSMGLLAPSDWKAKWIGMDGGEEQPSTPTECSWIWMPGENGAHAAPVGQRYFRRTVTVPTGSRVRKAQCLVSADNQCQLWVNGKKLGGGGGFHEMKEYDLVKHLQPGKNVLAVEVNNAGPKPNPAGLLALVRVELADGHRSVIPTDGRWRCFAQASPHWETVDFDDSGWKTAEVLGVNGIKPWGPVVEKASRRLPARMLRREFDVKKPISRATAYVCGLGLFELHVNGSRVSDHVLQPALSEYGKRVYYVTFDVTDALRNGRNALGVMLGNGRYYAPRLSVPTRTGTFGFPRLLLQLDVEHADGTRTQLVSDESWRLTTAGPIQANNEYDGEEYDARREMPGWSRSGFDDARWSPAAVVSAPDGALVAQMIDPIRIIETVRPKSIANPAPGVYVFDMGQNMVGWCRLKVRGPRGASVSLRHAETVHPDGTLYMDNIRSAKVTDVYVLRGDGEETYEPRFTYHGFRFVEVTGLPAKPTLDSIEGCVVHDSVRSAGTFTCSNGLLNRIYGNIRWGVRGNYRSMPTDCPQRDERQGWLGDRSAESKGETYLFDVAALYAKWLTDIEDAQKPTGSVPDVAPSYWPIYSDNVTWPSSFVIVPGSLYEQYGDVEVVARHYAGMKKWIDYMSRFIRDGIMPRDTYGDWCMPPESQELIHSKDPRRKTAKEVLGTTYFCHDVRSMARYATLLGKSDDAARFSALADQLQQAFNARYYHPATHCYDNGTPTSSVLPLAFGMVPADQRSAVFAELANKIQVEHKGHIGTGLIGGQWLNRVLTIGGRPDLVYTMATQTTYPSWGYMIEHDATTIWELWNGNTADPAMNSHNHVMLIGDLNIWLHECLAGIRSDLKRPGFKHVIMRPEPVVGITHVAATYLSMRGPIASRWNRGNGVFRWEIELPANTTATVHVPADRIDLVTESGRPIAQTPGVRFVKQDGDRVVLQLGSGRYELQAADRRK